MKKIISLCLVFLLLLSGCAKFVVPKSIPHTVDLPDERPKDFAIFFRWGYSSRNFFDTYEGKIGKDLIIDGGAESELSLSEETLDKIYMALRRYDIASIDFALNSQNCAALGESVVYMTPCAEYTIRFRVDGVEYKITGDDTAQEYACSEQFFAFVEFMEELIYDTPEYQAFPQAKGGYM